VIGKGHPHYTAFLYYTESRLIRNGETAGAFEQNEQEGHCDSIEESGIHFDKQGLRDIHVNCLLITQVMTPKRPKKVIERAARIFFFLPENAYVRNIKMTENMTDTSVNNSL